MLESYGRKLLRVNLSTRQVTKEPLRDELLSRWVGGMGLGVKLFTHEVAPNVDPLGPDNKVFMCVGPLTGTLAPACAQTVIVTKSPLTQGILNTYAGGHLGAAIKRTGYDVIVFEGKADKLVYVLVTPDGTRIVDCPELAGLSAEKTEEAVKKAAGRNDLHTAAIGLAGENQVRFAAVISETRAFGRGGAGAVWGSKNLKAIGVAGIQDVRVANNDAFTAALDAVKETLAKDRAQPWSTLAMFGRTGTGTGISMINERHALATRHHRQGHFEHAEEIGGEAFAKAYETRPVACTGCPIHCGMLHPETTTKWGKVWTRGPEYETTYSLGSLCYNADRDCLIEANRLAEDYGMDTLSLGVTVAFAMECAERGIWPRDILGEGTRLEFGNAEAIVKLIHLIARREGVGKILANGTRLAAREVGHDAESFALQVKGMEFAAWMPERMRGIAVTFATSNRGACHKRAPIGMEIAGIVPMDSNEGRAALVASIQDKVNAIFTLVSCRFLEFAVPMGQYVQMLNAATGLSFTEETFQRLGETIYNLERLYNLEAGIGADQDKLPDICYEPLPDLPKDARPLRREDMAILMRDYYAARGWDANGRPTPERLRQLGLKDTLAAK